MEVILIKNHAPFGFIGDTIKVKNGFARNKLIPQGIALAITKENRKAIEHTQKQIEKERVKQKEEAEALAKNISELTLQFKLKVAGQSRTFGSITTKDIEAELAKKEIIVHKKYIILQDTIKSVGVHEVTVKLHTDVTAVLKIEVIADKSAKKAKKEDSKKKAKAETEEAKEGEATEVEASSKAQAESVTESKDEAKVEEVASEEE